VMKKVLDEGKLILIAIPVLLWTLLPIYHLFVLSISTQESMLAGKLWPTKPTLQNFQIVFNQQHYYLNNFWLQLFNSFLIAIATGLITLFVATCAAFAISRLKAPGGRSIMNFALATYLIPAAFLAIPMYKAMGTFGLLNTRTALILAMVALASPYAIWVLKQASDKLPKELDEAAIMDGATSLQLFRLVYLPLMKPSMVVIGIYALLLAWNEYLYAFLLLSSEQALPLAVGLGLFLSADDAPWNLLMTAGLIYAIPPAVIYYGFRNNMVSGLTSGAVKS
jgi:multiple sugar transport system permease protein